jgi:(2Fe-2S) ferredoxin
MPNWKHHVLVCTNQRPAGHPKGSCGEKGSPELVAAFKAQVEAHALWETVKVTSTGCLGPCAKGSTVVVYPEGCWYGGVRLEDVPEIVQEHFVGGRRVERLVIE